MHIKVMAQPETHSDSSKLKLHPLSTLWTFETHCNLLLRCQRKVLDYKNKKRLTGQTTVTDIEQLIASVKKAFSKLGCPDRYNTMTEC